MITVIANLYDLIKILIKNKICPHSLKLLIFELAVNFYYFYYFIIYHVKFIIYNVHRFFLKSCPSSFLKKSMLMMKKICGVSKSLQLLPLLQSSNWTSFLPKILAFSTFPEDVKKFFHAAKRFENLTFWEIKHKHSGS